MVIMYQMSVAVAIGASIAMSLCFLVVVARIFRAEGAVSGTVGLLMPLYAMIWGWRHRKEHNDIEGVLILWTTLFVLGGMLQLLAFSAGY